MKCLGDVGRTEQSHRIHVDTVDLDAEVQPRALAGMGHAGQPEPLALLDGLTRMHRDPREDGIGRPHTTFMCHGHRQRSPHRPCERHPPRRCRPDAGAGGNREVDASMTRPVGTGRRLECPRDRRIDWRDELDRSQGTGGRSQPGGYTSDEKSCQGSHGREFARPLPGTNVTRLTCRAIWLSRYLLRRRELSRTDLWS
jgi:hypothetical protein